MSDAFMTKEDMPELELRVKVLNINGGYNEDLKEQCRTLKEYMQYVTKVRSYARDMTIEEAVEKAVEESIQQDILKEFLLQNKAEVKKMSIYEYDDEAVKQALKEDAYEDGKREGMAQGIMLLLDSLETSESLSEELRKRIMEENDVKVLEQWLRIAARVKSVEEFSETIENFLY